MKFTSVIAVAVFAGASHPAVAQSSLSPVEISLGAGIASPVGQLRDHASLGGIVAAIADVPIGASAFTVRVTGSYARFGQGTSTVYALSGGPIPPKDGASYFEGNAGLGYNFPVTSTAKPYLSIGWGYYHGSGRVPANFPGGDGKLNHLGGSFGGGVKFKPGAVKMFIDARYVTLSGGDHYTPVMIGVSF